MQWLQMNNYEIVHEHMLNFLIILNNFYAGLNIRTMLVLGSEDEKRQPYLHAIRRNGGDDEQFRAAKTRE